MELKLRNRKALVTGGARGIGRAIAMSLATEGCHVAVVSRTQADVDALLKELPGTNHFGMALDLTLKDAPTTLIESLKKQFGFPEIAIQNLGGTLDITDPFCPLEDWQRVWRMNFEVALELNLKLLPQMRENRWGRIIHIASTSSLENNGPVTYCTAKAALAAYTRSMGRVLAKEGIVMSALVVGAVFTEGGYWDDARKTKPQHVDEYLRTRCPIGEFGTPEQIAHMVTFLASDLGNFCQGAIIPIDGGQSRHFFGEV